MSNKYIFIGDNKIAGPLKMQNPEERQYSYGGAYKAAMDSYSNYIASLPKIEVVKEPTHSWEINQILVEGVDVRIEQVNMIQRRCKPSRVNTKEAISKTVAVPISKPNTDVKLNTQYSEQNYSKGEGGAKYEWFNGDNWLNVYDIDKFKKDYPTATIRVKEVERLYSKEDTAGKTTIDFLKWSGIGSWTCTYKDENITIEQLFNLYLSSIK